jgi:hypothetical protein
MNKSITLSKEDWITIITGLDRAAEMADEVVEMEMCPEAKAELDAYCNLIRLIQNEIA